MTLRFSAPRNCLTALLLAAAVANGACSRVGRKRSRSNRKSRRRPPGQNCRGSDKTAGWISCSGHLKAAPDEASAKHVEARIWALWMQTPSDTAALLMQRAKAAMDAHQIEVAQKLPRRRVKLRPDYIEGWNRAGDAVLSQERLRPFARGYRGRLLSREPRHFGALAGLGMIMQDIGDEKRALDAFRKALAVNPHLRQGAGLVKTLSEKVEGREHLIDNLRDRTARRINRDRRLFRCGPERFSLPQNLPAHHPAV